VKKDEQPEHNGILKGGSSVSSIEACVGDSGISRVHTQSESLLMEAYDWYTIGTCFGT
jgi:hypothetical protein